MAMIPAVFLGLDSSSRAAPMNAPLPGDEAKRLEALPRLEGIDTPAESVYDALPPLPARLPREERKVLEETTRLNEELAALVALTDRAISTLDIDELLEALLERLVVVMKADAGAVMLEESGRLVVRCTRGLGKDLGELPTVAIGDGFGGRIAATGRPLYIADAQTDPRVAGPFLQERGVVTMLGVPLP